MAFCTEGRLGNGRSKHFDKRLIIMICDCTIAIQEKGEAHRRRRVLVFFFVKWISEELVNVKYCESSESIIKKGCRLY
jgi:hypothetical protein